MVVGSGPNGLAGAIRLAEHGLRVLVLEGAATIGGGARSGEITLPGFIHDLCSAIHPLGIGSPVFRRLPLERYGLEWIHPEFPLAHPLDDGTAVILHHSLDRTAAGLGDDATAYRQMMRPLLKNWQGLADEFLQPMLHWPRHLILLGRFGLRALPAASFVARRWFNDEPARALFGGIAAHSFLPLDQLGSSAFAVVLALLGHAVGWPLPRGGSGMLSHALAEHFRSLGGEICLNSPVGSLEELPSSRITLLEITPRQLLRIAGVRLPRSYRKKLETYRYGPGVFKIDYALNGPIPWRTAECRGAGTVHLGGTFDQIARGEDMVAQGEYPERPFVLLTQPTLFDPGRAPAGKHIVWAYTHVPSGSTRDLTNEIETQIERFAPGFGRLILARHAETCPELQARNPNLVGGDINGGSADLWQLLARPTLSFCPYRTPLPGVYLCSASTPPGGGVHGMCGYHGANAALKEFGRRTSPRPV